MSPIPDYISQSIGCKLYTKPWFTITHVLHGVIQPNWVLLYISVLGSIAQDTYWIFEEGIETRH